MDGPDHVQVEHVLRRNRREAVFHKPVDFDAFVEAMRDGQARRPVEVLGYCLIPNHFHLVIRTHADVLNEHTGSVR